MVRWESCFEVRPAAPQLADGARKLAPPIRATKLGAKARRPPVESAWRARWPAPLALPISIPGSVQGAAAVSAFHAYRQSGCAPLAGRTCRLAVEATAAAQGLAALPSVTFEKR